MSNLYMYDKIFQPYTSFIRQHMKTLPIEDPFVAYNTVAYYLTAEFSDNNFIFFPSVVMENVCKSLQGEAGFALLNAMRGETFDNEREVLQALYKNLSIPLGYLSKGFPWLLNEVMDVEPDWIALREVAKLITMEETPEGNVNFLITTAIDDEYLANSPADIIDLSKHLKQEYLKISKRCTVLVCPILSPESMYDCGSVTSFDSANDNLIELSKKYYPTHEAQHSSDDAGSKHQDAIQDCHEILSEYIDNYLDGCKELTKILNKAS